MHFYSAATCAKTSTGDNCAVSAGESTADKATDKKDDTTTTLLTKDLLAKYPPNAKIKGLDSTFEIKRLWLYSEWAVECQFSKHIRSSIPERQSLELPIDKENIALITATFNEVRGKYILWGPERENGRWKKIEGFLHIDWVKRNVEVLYPSPDRFNVERLEGLVFWKSQSGKRYKLYEGNHRISAWLAAQTPPVLPAIIFIGKPQKVSQK